MGEQAVDSGAGAGLRLRVASQQMAEVGQDQVRRELDPGAVAGTGQRVFLMQRAGRRLVQVFRDDLRFEERVLSVEWQPI
jgi:hypothetical protein